MELKQAIKYAIDGQATQNENGMVKKQEELMERLNACSTKDKETALQLLEVFLKSLT